MQLRISEAFSCFLAWSLRWMFPRRHANIGDHLLQNVVNKLDALTVKAQDIQRLVRAKQDFALQKFNFDRSACISVSVMSPDAPWLDTGIETINTPAMITKEEAQYYTYLGGFYEGVGRAVELGPWLGASTQHIVLSLAKNPRFAGERLHVFDDFTWRKTWMDKYASDEERLPQHASFRHLFEKYTEKVRDLLEVQQVKI